MSVQVQKVITQLAAERASQTNEFIKCVNADLQAALSELDSMAAGGTVTTVSVVTAHGFAGTVATATSTPAITLSATPIGVLQSDGTSMSAVTIGTNLNYAAGTLSATNVTSLPVATTAQLYGGSGGAGTAAVVTIGDSLQLSGEVLEVIPGQIVGTATNDNAAAGNVGEFLSNSMGGTALSIGVTVNAATISLTAGDWDIWGVGAFNAAATTKVNVCALGISPNTAAFSTFETYVELNFGDTGVVSAGSAVTQKLTTPVVRISLAATTTIFLVAESNFTVSTQTVDGAVMARRRR